MPKSIRPDRVGQNRTAFDKNRRRILMSQDICGICGLPVDKSLKFPDPMSPTIDHIIPIKLGGHPSDISNLQLAHFICNRLKSDKLSPIKKSEGKGADREKGTNLPLSMDWTKFGK